MILSPYTPGSVPPKLPGRADKLQQFRQAALQAAELQSFFLSRLARVSLILDGSCTFISKRLRSRRPPVDTRLHCSGICKRPRNVSSQLATSATNKSPNYACNHADTEEQPKDYVHHVDHPSRRKAT